MAKGFNLTAQLNIQGPNNLKPVISKLKTALDSVNGNINIKISGTSTKTIKGLTTALQSLSKASIQTNANLVTLSQTIGSLGSGLASLGGASSGVAGLGKVRSSVSSTKNAVVEATSALADFGKQSGLALKRFAAFTAVSTAAFSLGAAIKSGFQEFVVFDKEIVRLAQVTGKSTKELGGITKEITRLSTGLGVASADLLQVTTTLAQAGLTAGETKIALEALAKSALAPSFDSLKETTEGSIAAMRQFGIQAGELEAALGSVNAVAAAFAVESSDIITAIQRTGGVFASSSKGVSQGTDALNEFIAVFTSIRATTRESAETIATGLRTIFTRIQRGDTIEALKEYGIVLTDLKGKFVGPYEATRRLSEGLKSLDPRDLKFSKIVEELGGFRQIGKVIPLIKEFASAEAALEVAYKGQSSLAKDAAIAQQSLAVQFLKTRESFVALIRDIGDSASFKVFITLGLGLANAFITLAGALKPLLPMLLTLATIKIGSSIGEYSRSFMSGFAGKPKGKSGGGVIGFARGGFVPGTGSGDTIPAMLEPGEFVIRKKAVDTLGASNLHRMNKSGGGNIKVGGYAGGGAVQKFDTGGPIALGKLPSQAHVSKGYDYDKIVPADNIKANLNKTQFDFDETKEFPINWKKLAQNIDKKYQANTNTDKTRGLFESQGEAFEESVAEFLGLVPQSVLTSSSQNNRFYPIDIISQNKLGEIKFSQEIFDDAYYMSKLTRHLIKQNELSTKSFTNKVDVNPPVNVGSLDIYEMAEGAKKEFSRWYSTKDKTRSTKDYPDGKFPYELFAGGRVQKFGPGGLLRGGFQYKGSSRDSVANYQTASHKLNSSLLKGNHDPNDPLIKDLDGAPKQIPPKSLYTGFGEGRFGSMSQQLKSQLLSTEDISKVSGQNFALPGFLSTSTSVNQAKKFGNTGMLNISTKGQATAIDVEGTISPKDSKMRSLAADTNGLGSEREFILPRNAQMRLLSGSRSGSNQFLNLNVQELARGGRIQKFMAGGIAERKVGYLDTDVLRDPANQEVVGPAMQGVNLTDVAAYKAYLSKLAATSRKEGSLAKLRTIAGLPGAGKSSLMLGGSQSQVSDNAKLRRTTRFPILRPEDIKLASEVIDTTSTVTPEKLDEYLKASDKIYMLSTSTKEEQKELKRRRGLRDTTGVNLFGRKPGSTSGAETDSGSLEAMLGSDIDASKLRTLGISSDYKLKRKENIEVEKKKIALLHGSLSPSTVGHESLRTAATAMGMPIEDFLVLISSDEGITSSDSHSLRTAVFDQDFRVLAAQAAFKGSMVSKQTNRGFTLPDVMEISPGASGQRRFVRPTKDSLGMMVAGEGKNIKKYTDKDYKPVQIPRTGGVSGTGAREAILDGNLEEMKKILSPDVFSLVSKHLPQLQNRSSILPRIVEHAQKRQAYSLADITKELDSLPQRIDSKKVAKDPEYAAMAAQVKDLRNRRDKINTRASFEPFSILRSLAKRYPETYGLQGDTTLSQAVRESVRGQGIVAAKTMPINPGGAEGAKPKTGLPATAAQISNMLQGSNMPEDSNLGEFSGVDITDDMVRRTWRAGYDKSMSSDKAASYGAVRDYFLQQFKANKEMQAAKLAKRIRKSTKVGLVGLLPFDHSEDRPPIDIKGTDVTMYERGLDSQFAPQVEAMQAYQAAGVNKFAADIQMQASTGGLSSGQKMVYDFDQTLVTGADLFDSKGNIDILGYSDLDRVGAALKKGELTLLGLNLKQKLDAYPELLDNLRISTARPPTNKDLIAKRLAELGLNIPADKITGMNGADKSKNLADNETIVDDNIKTIERVRKAGKSGIEYAPIKSGLSDQQSMATGQANIEGAVIEQAMALFGAPIIDGARATRAIDYPNGLGPAASYFPGIGRDWPTEVKRTIDSDSRSQAIDEFTRYLFPEQVPVGKNLGGSIQKFAMGGASSDTVPAMLTPGEFVINKKAARSIGYGKLNKMNHADSVQGFANGGPVGGIQYFADAGQVATAAISTLPFMLGSIVNKVMEDDDDNKKLFENQAQIFLDMGHSAEEAGKKLLELAFSTKEQKDISDKAKASWAAVGIKEDPELPIARQKNINIVAMAAASTILTSKLQDLSATFAKSNSGIATGLGGLVSALEAGSSAMLSVSVAKQVAIQNNPEIAKAFKDPKSQASKALSVGTAAAVGLSAVGAGVSAVANRLLDAELAKNTKSLSEFDKSLQDLKDATDADAKSEARKRVQESFLALSKQIDSSKDTMAGSKTVKVVADTAVGVGSGLITFASTFASLLPLFTSLASNFPAVNAAILSLTAGITGVVTFLGTITLGPFILGVVAVAAVLGPLAYALGFFETNVNIVTPELTALAKAANAAAAASNALSLSSKSYISQQLAAASIIKETAKKNKQTPDEMRATFNRVSLKSLPEDVQKMSGLDEVYKTFDINPVNIALAETIIAQIHRINPKIDTVDKSLAEVMSQVTLDVGKKNVEIAKQDFIDRAYSELVTRDSSKDVDKVSGFTLTGRSAPPADPRQRALQAKVLAGTNQFGGGEAGDRNYFTGRFTAQGTQKAKGIIVADDAANENFAKINADLLKSQIKAVEMGITSLANTLKLFSSSITKTTEDLASSISLVNEQTAMYFGEGKIEGQKYNKEISALSNPSAATSKEIKGAYTVFKKNFSDQSPESQKLVDKMQSNTLAQSTAEQQLPAIVEAINKTYDTPELRNDAMDNVANMLSKQVASASGLDENDPQIVAYKTSLATSLRTTSDTAITPEKLGEITADYQKSIQAFANVTEEAKKALESLARANQLIADQQNTIVSQSLKNMELGFTQFSISNQFAIDKMRLFGESVSLDTLNAPVDNKLKTLTGGMTDPVAIGAAYEQKSREAQAAPAGTKEQTSLQTEANKLKQALDLLATSTDAAQNAMGKAAERQEALNTKRNLLESMLTGGAAKRSEMREFNNALVRLNKGDRGRLQTDIPLILKNIGQLGTREQTAIRGEISQIPGFEDVANVWNPQKDAEIQQSLATAGNAVATQVSALAVTMALNDTGIKGLISSLDLLKASVDLAFPKSISDIQTKTASTTADINKRSRLQIMEDRLKKFPLPSTEVLEKRRKQTPTTEEQKTKFAGLQAKLAEQTKSLRAEGYSIINWREVESYLERTDPPETVGELERRVSNMKYDQPEPFRGILPFFQPQTKPLIDSDFSNVTKLEKPIAALTQAFQDNTTTYAETAKMMRDTSPFLTPNNVGVTPNAPTSPWPAPLNQTPPPTTSQPTTPTQTAPSTDGVSNTKLFAPIEKVLGTLAGAMKALQETMAPTTTDTTSPTPNSPLNGVGVFKDSVASFVSAIQALEQVKIKTESKINLSQELFITAQTDIPQTTIDKIAEAWEINTKELLAKNTRNLETFG